jgi:aldose 1-epimerase
MTRLTKSVQNVKRLPFGEVSDGTRVALYHLAIGAYEAEIITFGAALRAFRGPDRNGRIDSVVLGYPRLEDYLVARERQGAIMGRFVNRIAGARFSLDGITYELARNSGHCSIHGGEKGFDRRVWTVLSADSAEDHATLQLGLVSPDGDQGFPGLLQVEVTYQLEATGSLAIDYRARTDKPTIINLTNHAYFNLTGEGCGSILDHELEVFADAYLPVNDSILPTGDLQSVEHTPFDFRYPTPLTRGVRADHEQIRFGRGYDHCFVLQERPESDAQLAARVRDPASGRTLEVFTTEPGLQLNSGNVLSGRFAGDRGCTYRQSDGFCLEAQHFPDSPNMPHFPSVVLRPDQTYAARTMYRLGIDSSARVTL